MATPRMFPTLTYKRNGPSQIPWEMAERAYAVYSAKYGKTQSLERMAERGGFATSELDMYIPGWREEIAPTDS